MTTASSTSQSVVEETLGKHSGASGPMIALDGFKNSLGTTRCLSTG